MQDTFEISVDWDKVSADKTGSVVIQSGDNKVTVAVSAKVFDTSGLAEKTYVYANGYASILPAIIRKNRIMQMGQPYLS